MGCTNLSIENDILADMKWEIDPETGLIQLSKLIPLEILYMDQHMDATGATWDNYNRALAGFILENKKDDILEIGGGSGKLAKLILQQDDKLEYTVVEPNPTFEESKRLKLIKSFFSKNISLNQNVKTIVMRKGI
jgi:phospholipid N-methyltransferase